MERDYGIRNAAPEARTVVIEHNKMNGYQLNPLTTQKPDETLPNAYRFRVVVAAGATVHLKVAESHAYQQGIQVGNINEQQIKVLINEMGSQAGEQPALLKQLQPILDAQRAGVRPQREEERARQSAEGPAQRGGAGSAPTSSH